MLVTKLLQVHETAARDAERSPRGPVFGTPTTGCPYVVRPSAYALVTRGGMVAVVHTSRACFLPGGGIEGAETP